MLTNALYCLCVEMVLLSKKVPWIPWEYLYSPTDFTDLHRWLGCVGPPTESTDFAEVRLRGTAVIIKIPEGLTLLNMFL